jgi:hypothetical protein
LDELMLAFKELGIQMDRAEAKKLLCRWVGDKIVCSCF